MMDSSKNKLFSSKMISQIVIAPWMPCLQVTIQGSQDFNKRKSEEAHTARKKTFKELKVLDDSH